MRCSDCRHFVSYDEPQVDQADVSVDGSTLRVEATVQLNCAECGGTLKEATIEVEEEISHECTPVNERPAEQKPDPDYVEGEDQYLVESDGDPEGTQRMDETDARGKVIPFRYRKTYYGFTIESEILCRKCGGVFTVVVGGDEQASYFEEVC